MKALLATLAAPFVLAAAPVFAADHADHTGHMHAAPAAAPLIDGVVKKVDKPAGKLTLSHGPLPNGMPAMTMAFGVKNPAWLDRLKAEAKIRIDQERLRQVKIEEPRPAETRPEDTRQAPGKG